jgi:Flp pilus assembly protein TadG
MVEFALIAPLLVTIVVGMIELGIVFSVYVGLTNSAREAVRTAAVYRYPGATPLTTDTAVVGTIDSDRELSMSTTLTATLNPIIPSDALTVTVAYLPRPGSAYSLATSAGRGFDPANPLRSGDTVSVTVQHRHNVLWGLLGSRDLVLRASSAARIEPGGAN